jgi:hypothetical protein
MKHDPHLEKAFVEDSAFPFKPDEPLLVKIDKNRIILEKAYCSATKMAHST